MTILTDRIVSMHLLKAGSSSSADSPRTVYTRGKNAVSPQWTAHGSGVVGTVYDPMNPSRAKLSVFFFCFFCGTFMTRPLSFASAVGMLVVSRGFGGA